MVLNTIIMQELDNPLYFRGYWNAKIANRTRVNDLLFLPGVDYVDAILPCLRRNLPVDGDVIDVIADEIRKLGIRVKRGVVNTVVLQYRPLYHTVSVVFSGKRRRLAMYDIPLASVVLLVFLAKRPELIKRLLDRLEIRMDIGEFTAILASFEVLMEWVEEFDNDALSEMYARLRDSDAYRALRKHEKLHVANLFKSPGPNSPADFLANLVDITNIVADDEIVAVKIPLRKRIAVNVPREKVRREWGGKILVNPCALVSAWVGFYEIDCTTSPGDYCTVTLYL